LLTEQTKQVFISQGFSNLQTQEEKKVSHKDYSEMKEAGG